MLSFSSVAEAYRPDPPSPAGVNFSSAASTRLGFFPSSPCNTRVNTFQDVRERARRARDWIASKRDFEQTQQELEQILGFSLFTLLLWFVTHGVLLFTDEILYDKFFLKAFLKAINLFVNLKMDEMTLEKFRLWNTAALKVYLSVREKSIEGSFDELASR